MFHAIFGIVLATTVPIIPLDYGDTAAAVVGAVCVFGGFLAAYFMDKGFRRIEQRADEK